MEEIKLYFRPGDVGDENNNHYEVVCGEADAAGETPAEALDNLAQLLTRTPDADAVRAAVVPAEGPLKGVPVPAATPDEALVGEGAEQTSTSSGPATKPRPISKPTPGTTPGEGQPSPSDCPEGWHWSEDEQRCVENKLGAL
jgi:hypothetical protein